MAEQSASNVQRHFHDEEGRYVLPNDSQEHDRLDAQSKALIALMHNMPFHAPLKDPKRILDVGCGTGAMTALLASMYPNAEVIGLDISPVPELHDKPENLKYVQGDVMDIGEGEEQIFTAGTFDYIFHRLLVFGMTDWPAYVSAIKSLLRPGGWIELQDLDYSILDRSEKRLIDDWWYYQYFIADCKASGLDIEVGSKLAPHLRDAGLFVNGNETVYKMPLKPDPELPEADLYAKSNQEKAGPTTKFLINKISGPRRGPEMIKKMSADVMENFGKAKIGDHCRMYVAVGQKPT